MFSAKTEILKLKLSVGESAAGNQLLEQGKAFLSHFEYESAYKSFALAITEYGVAEALVLVGRMHETGKKYPHDVHLAIKYYQLAWQQKVPSAGRYLGLLAIDGYQVSNTNNDPHRFLKFAVEAGDKECINELVMRGIEYERKDSINNIHYPGKNVTVSEDNEQFG